MTRHAAHGRNAAENRPFSRRKDQAGAVLGALVLALALPAAAAAQSSSGIYINNDVLNSLGPGPDAAPVAPMTPTPLTPGGPAPSYQYEAPGYAAPAPLPNGGSSGGLTFQTYGSGNFVVTRPGTLLFPPLEAPRSTMAPGFDNQAARTEAFNNAFAEGPEPTSQLLIPLDSGAGTGIASSGDSDSVIVNLDALPAADPTAQPGSGPVLTLRQPPMAAPAPAPRKPEVPAAMLAETELAPIDNGPAELAPEFQTPEPTEVTELAAPEAPAEVAEAAEPAVDETPEPAMAEAPAAAPAKPMQNMASATEQQSPAPAGDAPMSSAEVPAPVALVETPAPAMPSADAPVSLLPTQNSGAITGNAMAPEPAVAPAPAGLQTASLTVSGVEDMTFLFEVDSAELSAEVQSELRGLADTMRTNEEWIQVLGFASGPTGTVSGTTDQARKLALSRALKVRSFLIDAGIASARIQVRSLGDRAEGGPANRVDIRPIGS